MKVLLDECLPRKLKQELPGHEVATVQEMGWAGTKNGVLLRLAETTFKVFITIDQHIPAQQNLRSTKLALILLGALDNQLGTLRPLMPTVLIVLQIIRPGACIHVRAERR